MWDCPKCGATGKGVLLFNKVANCDECMGYVTKPVSSENIYYFYVGNVSCCLFIGNNFPKKFHRIAYTVGYTDSYSFLNGSFEEFRKKNVDTISKIKTPSLRDSQDATMIGLPDYIYSSAILKVHKDDINFACFV